MSPMDTLTLALVVLTFLLVLVTASYAYFTFRILKANEAVVAEMSEQRFAESRPYVLISVFSRIGTQLLYLSVENTGKAPAETLSLKFDRDFYQAADAHSQRNLASYTAFSQPIDSYPPGARMIFLLGVGRELFSRANDETRSPKVFTITAQYGFAGRKFNERTTLDLRPFAHSDIPHDPIVEELERLREAVKAVAQARL